MSSAAYPVNGNSSDHQAFVATQQSGQIQMQSIDQQTTNSSIPTIVNLKPTEPVLFLLKKRVIFSLGICTLIFGFIIFVCGICATALLGELETNVVSGGIWCGAIIIASGFMAILSFCKPDTRIWNALNLALHGLALFACTSLLVLCAMNLAYFNTCVEYFTEIWTGSTTYLPNRRCPHKDGGLAAYVLIWILTCAQIGISIAMVIFASRAYPTCRRCTDECDCCCFTTEQQYSGTMTLTANHSKSFHNGAMLPNAQQMSSSGQVLYMMTPVAITTQNPQISEKNQSQ